MTAPSQPNHRVGGIFLVSQAVAPFSAGQTGIWLKTADSKIYYRLAGGTDSALVTVGGNTSTVAAVNQAFTIGAYAFFYQPEAEGAGYGTVDENVALATPVAQPSHPTNLKVTFDAPYNGGDVVVHGKRPNGDALTETFTATPGGTVVGVKVFASIDDPDGIENLTPGGAGGDVATVYSGALLGLPDHDLVSITAMSVNGVNTTPAATSIVYGTVNPGANAKNGARLYEVWYAKAITAVQNGHLHTV